MSDKTVQERKQRDFRFDVYYESNADEKLSFEQTERDIGRLRGLLSMFLTLDISKYAHGEQEINLMSSVNSRYLMEYYVPFRTRKKRIRKIVESMLSCYPEIWETAGRAESEEFLERLVEVSLDYSMVTGDHEQLQNALQTADEIDQHIMGGIRWRQIGHDMLSKAGSILHLKGMVSGLYQAIGIYLINRKLLNRDQETAIGEAILAYKAVMREPKRFIIEDMM